MVLQNHNHVVRSGSSKRDWGGGTEAHRDVQVILLVRLLVGSLCAPDEWYGGLKDLRPFQTYLISEGDASRVKMKEVAESRRRTSSPNMSKDSENVAL